MFDVGQGYNIQIVYVKYILSFIRNMLLKFKKRQI